MLKARFLFFFEFLRDHQIISSYYALLPLGRVFYVAMLALGPSDRTVKILGSSEKRWSVWIRTENAGKFSNVTQKSPGCEKRRFQGWFVGLWANVSALPVIHIVHESVYGSASPFK